MKLLHIEVFPTGEKIAQFEITGFNDSIKLCKIMVGNDFFVFATLYNDSYLTSKGKTSTGEETKIYSFLF